MSEFDVASAGITAAATTVIAVIAKMLVPPPTLWREAPQAPYVVEFLVIVVVAVVIAGRKTGRRVSFRWAVPLTLVFTIAYFLMTAQFSCPFADNRMAIGWSHLPAAAAYTDKNPQLGCSLLIADFMGNTNEIWPPAEIMSVWLALYLTYVLTVVFAATTLVRVTQHVLGK